MISAAASFCLSGISSVNIRDPEWRFSRSCRNIKETWAQNYDGAMTVAPHGVCFVIYEPTFNRTADLKKRSQTSWNRSRIFMRNEVQMLETGSDNAWIAGILIGY